MLTCEAGDVTCQVEKEKRDRKWENVRRKEQHTELQNKKGR